MDTDFGNPEWIATARSFVTSLGAGDTDGAMRSMAPDISYKVLGHHALSGPFSGRDAVTKHLKAIITQTDGRFDPVKFEDWMLGLSHVSVLVDVLVEVGGASQLLQHLLLMRFNSRDLVEEVTVFSSDPEVAERLYGHYLREVTPR